MKIYNFNLFLHTHLLFFGRSIRKQHFHSFFFLKALCVLKLMIRNQTSMKLWKFSYHIYRTV